PRASCPGRRDGRRLDSRGARAEHDEVPVGRLGEEPKGPAPPTQHPLSHAPETMPHIETLKKHAKQLVRWHKDGVYTVGERLRAGLPRLAALSDAEVLAAPFSLADAQGVIAREQGFADWAALKAGLADQPELPKVAEARS